MTPKNVKAPEGSPKTRRRPDYINIQEEDYNTPLEKILPRLKNVKPVGPGKFLAICPAHQDKSPSLSIRELTDGKILLNCFAGCETRVVLSALYLHSRDLYPHPALGFENHSSHSRSAPPRFSARELLDLIHFEGLVSLIAARTLQKNNPLSEADIARLALAVKTLEAALQEVSHGHR